MIDGSLYSAQREIKKFSIWQLVLMGTEPKIMALLTPPTQGSVSDSRLERQSHTTKKGGGRRRMGQHSPVG